MQVLKSKAKTVSVESPYFIQNIIYYSVSISVIERIFCIQVKLNSNLRVCYAILNLGKQTFSSCLCVDVNRDIPLQ